MQHHARETLANKDKLSQRTMFTTDQRAFVLVYAQVISLVAPLPPNKAGIHKVSYIVHP